MAIQSVATQSGSKSEETGRRRFVDRLNPELVSVLTILGFGLPIVSYFWLIFHYGINVPYQDGWSDISVIDRCYSHILSCGTVWTQHNENRMLFPNLVVLVLAHTTRFNVRSEELLSGLMLVASAFLLIHAHKRRSPQTPWLYYCPVMILACTFAQSGATLWGFQMAWYLVLLSLAVVVELLDRTRLTGWTLTLAIGAAVIGCFSSLQGLVIWPVGLVLIWYRARGRAVFAAWIISACASTAVYLYHLNIQAVAALPSFLTHHSVSPVYFAIFAIGDVLGVPVQMGGSNTAIFLTGCVIVVLAFVALAMSGLRPDKTSPRPVGAALICFGLLFSILVAIGRHGLGYWAASSSGYTIYNVWILIGIYMILLDRARSTSRDQRAGSVRSRVEQRAVARYALWLTSALMVFQLGLGLSHGLDGARTIHSAEVKSAATARHIGKASDIEVLDDISFYQAPLLSRQEVSEARAFHLTLFGGAG